LSVLASKFRFLSIYPISLLARMTADYGGNRTVFKADPKKEEVKVAECLFAKLESAPEGKGVAGLWATELRVYMDFGTIHAKGKELMDLVKK